MTTTNTVQDEPVKTEENNTEEAVKPSPKKKVAAKKTTRKKAAPKKSKEEFPQKEDGSIDWIKMIPDEFIVPQDKNYSGDVKDLSDRDKMILLGGWKYLLKKRGYTSKRDIIHCSTRDYVSMTCEITWAENKDIGEGSQVYSASADAHFDNTDRFMTNYLTTNAENRAFARCVRGYLNINIVGKDETNKATIDEMLKQKENDSTTRLHQTPQKMLQLKAESMKKTLVSAKKWLVAEGRITEEEASEIKSWDNIDKSDCFTMIDYLQSQS